MMMMVASRVLLLCLLCVLCCWVGGGESWDYNYCTEKDWVLLKSVLNKSDADIETHCSHNKTFVDLVTANSTNAQADGKTTEETTRGSPEGTTGANAGHSGTPNTASGAGVSSGPSPTQPGPSAPVTQPARGDGAGERGGEEGGQASVDPQKNSGQQEASDGSSGRSQSAHEVSPRSESTVHPDTAPPNKKDKPPAEGSVSEDNDRAVPNTAPTAPSETVTESRSSTEVTNTPSAESSETNTSTTGSNVTQNADGSDIITLWVGAYSLLLLFVLTVFASTVV